MNEIDRALLSIDNTICENIAAISVLPRGLVSQNILAQSRNLVEHVALKAYSLNHPARVDYDSLKAALQFIVTDNKYLFLRKFHTLLQESKSHYTPNGDGAERLALKYHEYYLMLRAFVKDEYGLEILSNLEVFPLNIDMAVKGYYIEVSKSLKEFRPYVDFSRTSRLYVMRSKPIYLDGEMLYENTFVPANDVVSKFDRFIAFSKFMIPDHYSIRGAIFRDEIEVNGQKMPINVLTDFEVSIRPCEINNFSRIFGNRINITPSHNEYKGLMKFLTQSGATITDIIIANDEDYNRIKADILFQAKSIQFFEILDAARELVLNNHNGSNIVRYLASIMRNKVIKDQIDIDNNVKLSDLCLNYGCIPFDQMPFATSLINHNPEKIDVVNSISPKGRDMELMARHIQDNTSTAGHLYTNVDELTFYGDVAQLAESYNDKLYYKHTGRRIEIFGRSNAYIKEYYDDTKYIIEKMIELSSSGIAGYKNSIQFWMDENPEIVNCEEKRCILSEMFEDTCISLVYGAAGTGKTYLLNHISQFFDDKSKLYLANTHPAVDNLKRKIKAQNCTYLTISKFVKNSSVVTDYDIIFIDECSMISNSDMRKLLQKAKYKLLVLVGDTYQIESITFGNWFDLAKFFVPRKSFHELTKPYRAQNQELLDLWTKVRRMEEDITEHLVHFDYSSPLDATIFERKSEDEIILCLNYNGLYGINNINRFLQNSNSNQGETWGLWTYKIGDPILFNEVDRFSPVVYNNLKGTIVNIQKEDERIWFEIELDIVLNEWDVEDVDLELLEPRNPKKSIVGFWVYKKEENDDDSDGDITTVVPFQIAYAVSIHKAQGLEYDSVKVVITEDIDEMISHNIFYTAITRARNKLKIYWSPESMQQVINGFDKTNVLSDANIFSAHSGLRILNRHFN